VSRYQKGETNLDLTEARDSEWQWNSLGHMQVCTLLQTDNHASTPPLSQQCQSTEGNNSKSQITVTINSTFLAREEQSQVTAVLSLLFCGIDNKTQ